MLPFLSYCPDNENNQLVGLPILLVLRTDVNNHVDSQIIVVC